jgi:hypothetical protein
MYVIVPSPVSSFDIRPHGPPSHFAFPIMNLVRRFVEQIGLILDSRWVCVIESIEVGRFVHVEPDTVVFGYLSVFVETVFPPLSDVGCGPVWEDGRSDGYHYSSKPIACGLPRPDLSDKLFAGGMFEENILFVAICIDFVGIFGVFLVGHTNRRIDQRNIVLLVLM